MFFVLSSNIAVILTYQLISNTKWNGLCLTFHFSFTLTSFNYVWNFSMFKCLAKSDCPCIPRFKPPFTGLQSINTYTSTVLFFIDCRCISINYMDRIFKNKEKQAQSFVQVKTEMGRDICQSQESHESITWLKSFHCPFSCVVGWRLKSSYFLNTILIYYRCALENWSVTLSWIVLKVTRYAWDIHE